MGLFPDLPICAPADVKTPSPSPTPIFKRLRAKVRQKPSGHRKYAEIKIGDVFGCWRVYSVLGRGHQGRADQRFRMVCDICQSIVDRFESNVRRQLTCSHPQTRLVADDLRWARR